MSKSTEHVPVIAGETKEIHEVESYEIWVHGKDCDCGQCNTATVPYIVYDNGEDFADVDIPAELGDEIIWTAQDGRGWYVRRIT